ncbi:hypothetical protein RB195_025155 [Necator americanus]|uniref:Uncharacterized protein n=1 Tax=Necator americanus TaxID=51031 RepID=A0ABR1ERB6_NECAM
MADQLEQESLEEQIASALRTVMQTLQRNNDMKRIIIDNDHLLHDHTDAAKQQLLSTSKQRSETRTGERPCQAIALPTWNLTQRLLRRRGDQTTQVEPRTQANREQDEPPSSRDGKRHLDKNQPAHLEAKKRKKREEEEMNDDDAPETMDEVGEAEREAKDEDEREEPSEEDVVTEQIE